MKLTKAKVLIGSAIILILLGIAAYFSIVRELVDMSKAENEGTVSRPIWSENGIPELNGLVNGELKVSLEETDFTVISSNEIKIKWKDSRDSEVSRYVIMRADSTKNGIDESSWKQIGELESDGEVNDEYNSIIDTLESSEYFQYAYRIDSESNANGTVTAEKGDVIPASNVVVCIDPAHYLNKGTVFAENSYSYAESRFVLKTALALRDVLKDDYGIDCRMTRETDNITIEGMSDYYLDHYYPSLRGKFAKGCSLFVSLHTNENREEANGYPTFAQPIELNKTIVFVNSTAANSKEMINAANSIGEYVSRANIDAKISNVKFSRTDKNGIMIWSAEYNDALELPGSLCRRLNDNGSDYYPELRGAAEVGVPGILIQHAYHTVPQTRKAAAGSNLYGMWAEADAAGIAEGFGFSKIL